MSAEKTKAAKPAKSTTAAASKATAARTTTRKKSAAAEPAAAPVKQKRDPVGTRTRILNAALAEFSKYGLGGGRVERITERAGANKRMLYYYFGKKEQLFVTVLEETYGAIGRAEGKMKLDDLGPIESMRALISFLWDYFWNHPEFIRILNSENLHQAKHLKKSKKIKDLYSPLVGSIERVLREGQAAGLFRQDVDIVNFYITLTGMGYFYLSNKYTLATLLGAELMTSEARAARLKHMTEVILSYLCQPTGSQAGVGLNLERALT